MAQTCAKCGAEIPDGTTNCFACSTITAPATGASNAGLADNIAGMLAYVTIIPAILFLLIEPFNKNRFVRFHAFQCLFVFVASIVLNIALRILASFPVIGGLIALAGYSLLSLLLFVIWLLLMFKAYQGQKFKLPVIGDMAEKQANAV